MAGPTLFSPIVSPFCQEMSPHWHIPGLPVRQPARTLSIARAETHLRCQPTKHDMPFPNILILCSDEHPPQLTGCYGHRSVITPTLDGLAEGGAVFDAAYCASPICAPSRACMMTSRHVHRTGVWDNAAPLSSDQPTWAHSFRAAGYRTALCGKMHFVGPDQHHGFEERWTQDIYPADFRWTRSRRHELQQNHPKGQHLDRVRDAGPGWTPDMDYDEEVLFRARNGIREFEKRPDGRPWLLTVSFTAPHYPFRAPVEYWNRYRDEDVDLPNIPENFLHREHEYIKWIREEQAMFECAPAETVRAARRAIMARTTMLDDYAAAVLQSLRATGMLEDTIVVYISDHGDMLGEHGLWFKNTAYEWSARVPWIVKGPGVQCQRIPEVVSLLDLGPTLCGLVGIEQVYTDHDGRDLSPLLRGERKPEAGEMIMENYGEGVRRGVRTIRRGAHKLSWATHTEPELFDLEQDPDEWTNLAGNPDYTSVRESLMARLLENWNPATCDEARWQSEERRLAIMRAMEGNFGWQFQPQPVRHPLGFRDHELR